MALHFRASPILSRCNLQGYLLVDDKAFSYLMNGRVILSATLIIVCRLDAAMKEICQTFQPYGV